MSNPNVNQLTPADEPGNENNENYGGSTGKSSPVCKNCPRKNYVKPITVGVFCIITFILGMAVANMI